MARTIRGFSPLGRPKTKSAATAITSGRDEEKGGTIVYLLVFVQPGQFFFLDIRTTDRNARPHGYHYIHRCGINLMAPFFLFSIGLRAVLARGFRSYQVPHWE